MYMPWGNGFKCITDLRLHLALILPILSESSLHCTSLPMEEPCNQYKRRKIAQRCCGRSRTKSV